MKKHQIKNPSVTLYAFHIREDLAHEVATDAHCLWENLSELGKPLGIPELQHLTQKLICYTNGTYTPTAENSKHSSHIELIQPDRELTFQPILQDNELRLSGFLYPVRIHDTYATDLTLCYDNQEIDITHLRRFNPGGCLLPSRIQSTLGQTLLLYAEPADNDIEMSALADECVNAFLKDAGQPCPIQIHTGKLFGSPLFEYEIPQDSFPPCHIILWLNTHPQTLDLIEKADLMNLFCCRSKILFTYHQACQSNENARKIYNALENQGEILHKLKSQPSDRISSLETLLTEMPPDMLYYAHELRNMEDFHTMILTNAKKLYEHPPGNQHIQAVRR